LYVINGDRRRVGRNFDDVRRVNDAYAAGEGGEWAAVNELHLVQRVWRRRRVWSCRLYVLDGDEQPARRLFRPVPPTLDVDA